MRFSPSYGPSRWIGRELILLYRCLLLQSVCLLYPASSTQGVFGFLLQGRHSGILDASLEVSFPSALVREEGPLLPGLPRLARSTLKVSHLLSGFLPFSPSGFVSPRNAPGIFPFRAFPSERAGTLLRAPSPLAVTCNTIRGRCRFPSYPGLSETKQIQLQGFVPFRSPFAFRSGLDFGTAGALLRLLLFRGFPLLVARSLFRRVPLLRLFGAYSSTAGTVSGIS